MKIGILTFHASHNYGSMLQAWALQHYLNSIGHDAETINLRIKAQRDKYNFPLRPIKNRGWIFFKSLLNPLWLYHACRKWWAYEKFLENNLHLTSKAYDSWQSVKEDLARLGYGCVITGGDQIWNIKCKDYTEAYYLPSDLGIIRKISYSPSFGPSFLSNITEQQRNFISKSLSDYSHISVRESSMRQYLSILLNRDVSQACDPTLLLHAEDYSRFITEDPIIKGRYIYYYTPRLNAQSENLAIKIGKHYGMKVVTSFPHLYNNKMVSEPESGPAEFLNLLKNATFVIGKSFHLVVFSLLFHKDFIAIEGDRDARMRSILEKLHVLERGQVTEDNYMTIKLAPIDYNFIDQLLEDERQKSIHFLELALS